MNNTLLVAFLTVAGMALIAGCDKATASTSDGSMPGYRRISSQFHADCPSLGGVDADSRGTSSKSPRAPWPANTDSVDAGIYNGTGFLIKSGHLALAAEVPIAEQLPFMLWNARYSDGSQVPSGVYFEFFTLRDSTGAVVGHDSACIGVSNAPMD